MQVKLKDIEKIRLLNSDDIYSIMQRVLLRENAIERNKEHFWIIGLNTINKILYIELITVGTVNKTLISPMETFSIALQKQSVKVIMIHNHPSGSISPGDADKDLTDYMIQVGLFLNVPVIDHLIISEKSYYSFADSGLLEQLAKSEKYVLPYLLKERKIKEHVEEVRAKSIKERNIEIARILKAKGTDIELIRAATGLSIAEIRKIRVVRKGRANQ